MDPNLGIETINRTPKHQVNIWHSLICPPIITLMSNTFIKETNPTYPHRIVLLANLLQILRVNRGLAQVRPVASSRRQREQAFPQLQVKELYLAQEQQP